MWQLTVSECVCWCILYLCVTQLNFSSLKCKNYTHTHTHLHTMSNHRGRNCPVPRVRVIQPQFIYCLSVLIREASGGNYSPPVHVIFTLEAACNSKETTVIVFLFHLRGYGVQQLAYKKGVNIQDTMRHSSASVNQSDKLSASFLFLSALSNRKRSMATFFLRLLSSTSSDVTWQQITAYNGKKARGKDRMAVWMTVFRFLLPVWFQNCSTSCLLVHKINTE